MAEEEDNSSWSFALEAAILEPCSLQDLRLICRGRVIPETMRLQIWHRFLGISVDHSDGLENFNEIYDLSNQSVLRDDCGLLVSRLDNDEEDKVSILSDLESLLTHYCKSHNKNYHSDSSWMHVLTPLISLKLPKCEIYTLFNTIIDSYVPRDHHINGAAAHLFRLLLLYHDPELCSFLDSHKIAPHLYTRHWFLSLFAVSCNIPAVLNLWDYYFVHGDPFLIFFLALVLVINAKDDIVALKGEKEKILELIAGLPEQMDAGDIHDFCSLAVLYSAQTPTSYKRDYHQVLFEEDICGNPSAAPVLLSQALCIPVSVNELLSSCKLLPQPSRNDLEVRCLRFFLVDCRPAEQYNAGHLPTAFHLDSNLMLTEPQAFSVAVQALLSAQKQSIAAQSAAGGEHLAFFGSGREIEDQYVHMVVAFFLQRHVQFVGLVQGGFQAVHQSLANSSIEDGAISKPREPVGLVDHNAFLCLVCREENVAQNQTPRSAGQTTPVKSDFFERIRSKSAVVKDKLIEYIVNPNISPENQNHSAKSTKNANALSVGKGKTPGKLYRNLAPVFSIDDDQDDADFADGVAEREEVEAHQEIVDISIWLKKPDVMKWFACHEVTESNHKYPSYLLVTETSMYALREIADRPGFGRISVHRSLVTIMKITSKKRHPEFITFKYGSVQGDETIITDRDRFLINEAGDAVKLVKQQLYNLKVF